MRKRDLKELIALLLAAIMCMSLAACGGSEVAVEDEPKQVQLTEPTPEAESTPEVESAPEAKTTEEIKEPETEEPEAIALSIGDTIDNENFSMSFGSMEILDEYSYNTSEYSSTSLYVEDGYKILLVCGHIENKSTSVISDSSFARTVVVNGTYTVTGYDVRLDFKRNKYFEIDPYTDLDYFLYINIPEKLAAQFETATFTLGFNNDMSIPVTKRKMDGIAVTLTDNLYAITNGTASETAEEITAMKKNADEAGSSVSKVKTIALGDVISTDDFDFTLNKVELTYELKPSNTSSVYLSYKAPDGKIYIHVDGSYYNKAKKNICIRDLFTPSADFDNGYTYEGFAVVDDGDNDFTWASSYIVCTPLETCHYHGLIECPELVGSSDASLKIYLEIGGEKYEYTIH